MDLNGKNRDLEALGAIIEEHTQQLEGLERREHQLEKREGTLRQTEERLTTELEKVRQQQISLNKMEKAKDCERSKHTGIVSQEEFPIDDTDRDLKIHELNKEINVHIEQKNQIEREANDLRSSHQRLELEMEGLMSTHDLTVKNLEEQLTMLRKDRHDQLLNLT